MNKKFLLALSLFAVAMFLLQYRMPQQFSWEETFSNGSSQPFGCRLFDSALAVSMPHGYKVTALTPWQLNEENSQPHALIVHQRFSEDYDELMQLARRGWRVLLLIDCGSSWMRDTLRCNYSMRMELNARTPLQSFRSEVAHRLHWEEQDDGYAGCGADFELTRPLVCGSFWKKDSCQGIPLLTCKTDEESEESEIIAMRFTIGKGELMIAAAPLLFTNYAILNNESLPVTARILDRLKGLPLIRIDKTLSDNNRNTNTPLIVFLEKPPLRLAVYLTLLTIALFMLCTARRRQRVIPVINPPKNNNMEFVRLIGSLYYHRRDHHGLLQKKLAYTAEEIRRLTGIDIEHENDAPERLSARTGIAADELRQTLNEVRESCRPEATISEEELCHRIDQLDRIIGELNPILLCKKKNNVPI